MAEKPKDFQISDESVDILIGKIHQLEFVDLQYKLKTYSCRQCGHVAIKHRIANCQDVFCYECYGQYYGKTCPFCGTLIAESIHDDDFMKTVLNFNVACEFKKNGCQTVVRLGEFLDHVKVCRQATKRLLPKIYKVNPQTEALEQMNAHFEDVKCFMRDLQTENKQLRDAIVEVQVSAVATNEQLKTVTNELLTMLCQMKVQNETQFDFQKSRMKRQDEQIDEMKKNMDGLRAKQHETSVSTNKLSKHVTTATKQLMTVLGDIQTVNETQFTKVNTVAKKHGQEMLDLKKAMDGMENAKHMMVMTTEMLSVLDQIKQENTQQLTTMNNDLQNQLVALKEGTNKQETEIHEMKNVINALEYNQLESGVAISEHVTTVTNQVLSRLGEIKTQNDKQLPAIKEDANKLEKDLHELNKSTKEQQTTVATKMKSMSDQIESMNNQLQEVKTKYGEESVAIKKAIAGVAGTTNEQLTTVKQQMISRFYRIEMQNKMQLEYKQTQSTDFSSFLRKNKYGETLPRDLRKEVNSCDPLDTKFNWTISKIREKTGKCKEKDDVFAESEEFSIPSHGLKFRAELWRGNESRMCIYLNFTNKPSADSRPFFHSRKYVLVDQSNGGGKKDVVMLDEPYFGKNSAEDMTSTVFRCSYFFPFTLLPDSDKYVKNDTILIRIILEPIALMFKRVSSMDGTLLLRIDNYTERKREEVEGIRRWLTSESFYTSDKGHRMDLQIYLNGSSINEGKGISIRPKFRIGEWDDSLSFPFKCKYTQALMDQSDAPTKTDMTYTSSVQECQNYDDFDKNGNFTSHEDVEKLPYLKDDSLLFKFNFEIVKP